MKSPFMEYKFDKFHMYSTKSDIFTVFLLSDSMIDNSEKIYMY